MKKETVQAFHAAVDDNDDDDLLVPREKTKDEVEREEEEYQEFLQREVGHDLKDLITVDADENAPVVAETEGPTSDKAEKKKRKKANKEEKEKSGKSKEDEDQQFLLECVSTGSRSGLNTDIILKLYPQSWLDRQVGEARTYLQGSHSVVKQEERESEGRAFVRCRGLRRRRT